MKTDNELIAEFMGGWNESNHTKYLGMNVPADGNPHWEDQWYDYKDMKYSSSWDWLMPVIEKISLIKFDVEYDEKIPVGFPEDEDYYTVKRKDHDFHYPRTFGMVERDTKQFMFRFNPGSLFMEDKLIDAAYKAVVEFIKWYNQQNQ